MADERPVDFEARLTELEARVAALEHAPPALARPTLAADGDLLVQLRELGADPTGVGENLGSVTYAGAVTLPNLEYSWQIVRPVAGLLALELEPLAHVLAALGSPQRLLLLRALLEGPRSSQQLQEALGVASPGPLYHHLKELLAAGLVEQRGRSLYQLAPRNIVPFLTALALAYDMGGQGEHNTD